MRVVMPPMLPTPAPRSSWTNARSSSARHRDGGRPARSRHSRARCAWSAYPHSAATSASRRRGSRAASTERSNRVIRTAALGVMPSSPRNRCSRCRVDHPTSDATPATGVRPPPHRISRQACATSGEPPHRDSCRRISPRTTRSTAANRSGHVAYPSSSSRRDRATRPTTSSSRTEVSASSPAGIPNTARAPLGVRPSCSPCWRPSWWISVGPVASPASTPSNGDGSASRPPLSHNGSSNGTTSVRAPDGSPTCTPGEPPAYR